MHKKLPSKPSELNTCATAARQAVGPAVATQKQGLAELRVATETLPTLQGTSADSLSKGPVMQVTSRPVPHLRERQLGTSQRYPGSRWQPSTLLLVDCCLHVLGRG